MRKRIFWAIKLLITAVILYILVYTIKLDAIIEAIRNADKKPVYIALALIPVNLLLQAVKWRILLTSLKPSAKWFEVFSSLLVGFTLGLVTPGRIGEYSRAFAVKDTNPLQVLGISLADKFYNLACTALFGGLAIFTLPGMVLQQNLYIIITSILLYSFGAFIIIYLALHPGFIRGLLYSFSLMIPKRDKLKALISCLDGITQKRARTVFLLSIAFFLTFITQFYLLATAFSDLAFIDGIRGLPAIIFTKTFLPISLGGLGVGELASVQFLSLFKVEPEDALNASLVLFAFNVLMPGLVGIFFIPQLRFNKEKK